MLTVSKRHFLATAHRLYDYNGKCERLHGHNYLIEITVTQPKRDEQGMIIDFAELNNTLLKSLDLAWDHKTLLYKSDPLCAALSEILKDGSVVPVPFNPTAENMASYLGEKFFPTVIAEKLPTTLEVIRVTVFETENNAATPRWVL